MLMDPLLHNQNMNSRTMDSGSDSGGIKKSLNTVSGHGCIKMMSAENVVVRAKDYGSSQPDLGKEPTPPETHLCIDKPSDKPEYPPCIPRGVLKHPGHNPNA